MVTALIRPNTQSGIVLTSASEEKTRCSFSYAKDCKKKTLTLFEKRSIVPQPAVSLRYWNRDGLAGEESASNYHEPALGLTS